MDANFITALAGVLGAVSGASAAIATTCVRPAMRAGVKVAVQSQGTGERRETVSNGTGQYAFPFLAPGEYELQFSLTGFTTVTRKMNLAVTERVAVDAVLRPAGVSEQVEVTEPNTQLQTETVALGRVVDDRTVKELSS
jgi:hypothetical protein